MRRTSSFFGSSSLGMARSSITSSAHTKVGDDNTMLVKTPIVAPIEASNTDRREANSKVLAVDAVLVDLSVWEGVKATANRGDEPWKEPARRHNTSAAATVTKFLENMVYYW